MIVRLNSFVAKVPNRTALRATEHQLDAATVTGGLVGSGDNYRQGVYAKPGETGNTG